MIRECVRFTGRRDAQNALVTIRKVQYHRGQENSAECTFEPPEAGPPDFPSTNDSEDNTGIAGGVTTAVVVVVAVIIIGGIILWQKRRRQRDHHETDADTASPLPHADTPTVSPDNYGRLSTCTEQREYVVLPIGERPAVAGTAVRKPNYPKLPITGNGPSSEANAAATKGDRGSNVYYLSPVMTMPVARDTTSRSLSGEDSSGYYLTPVTALRASEESNELQSDESSQPEYLTIIA
ncbi:uncharacterized protein [Littorina saxatilis]|uniref:uncharacterized protein n=1 Tax=Littorina saxatilis TaxID=31220 RepID=UPI0038B5114F